MPIGDSVRVVLLGSARARYVEHCKFQTALQVRGPRPPQSCTTHAEHFQDLRLRHAAIQAGQRVGSIDFPRPMDARAANRIHGRAISLQQMQFGLSHGYISVSQLAVSELYSCSVTYVFLY